MITTSVSKNESGVHPVAQTIIGYVGIEVLSSPSSQSLQDMYDIATALKTETLYMEQGRAAFISLEHYRERRRKG